MNGGLSMQRTGSGPKPGDVLSYMGSEPHCRQGTAIVVEGGRAFDTFLGVDPCDSSYWLRPDEIAKADVIFNLADYELFATAWESDARDSWEGYHPNDRQRIRSQHQYQQTLYLRPGAKPHLATRIEKARSELERAEAILHGATRGVRWARKRLDDLLEEATAHV